MWGKLMKSGVEVVDGWEVMNAIMLIKINSRREDKRKGGMET